MAVYTAVQGRGPKVDRRILARDARVLLAALGLPRAELSIVVCDDATIRPLNLEWRGKDAPTDVLSFPQEEADEPGRFAVPPLALGDIVLSTETATRQAAELGHGLDTELKVLLVHGLLHLVGHDHEGDDLEGARRMGAEERRLLALLGVDGEAALIERAAVDPRAG